MGICRTCKYWKTYKEEADWGECMRSRELEYDNFENQSEIKMVSLAMIGAFSSLYTHEDFGCEEFVWIHGDY